MKNHKNKLILLLLFVMLFTPNTMVAQDGFDQDKVAEAIAEFRKADAGINSFFDNSYGYAVFPSIGKGAIVIGGAAGKGLVYKQGTLQGGSKMKQVTVGFQMGGKSYAEVIFFKTADAYERFISNEFQFAAQASAVALKSGAAANAKYTDGVAVFTLPNGGLMYEASIGGQRFKFVPLAEL